MKIGDSVTCDCGATFSVTRSVIQTDVSAPDDEETVGGSSPVPPPIPQRGETTASDKSGPPSVLVRPAGSLPETIDRFEILSRLGEGTFGVVYRARDPLMNREVALKLPLAATFQSEEALTRFVREAQTAGRLAHPNIVTVYEVVVREEQIYIASAFIEGETLDAAIQRGNISFKQIAEIIRRLADALDYAHGQGITHRDIKPANIILDRDGQPHLLDFGLAKLHDERLKASQDGQVMGTPAYMSPEQAKGGERDTVGPASDQYSLGVVMYELLTGRCPFDGPLESVIYSVIHKEPPAPRSLRADIPRDLETICRKAMSKEPAQRYASSAELAADLHRWQTDLPIRARRVGPIERFKRWCKRNPLTAGLVMAVFLVFLIGAVTSSVFAVKAERRAEAEKEAQGELAEALESANRQLYISRVTLAGVKWKARDLGGIDDLLTACPPRYRHWEWYYLRHAMHGDNPTLNANPEGVVGVSYSPDGRRIVSASRAELRIWEPSTGRLIRTINEGGINSVAFSPDGRRIVSGGQSTALIVWETQTGRKLLTLKGHTQTVSCVAFSPNGKFIASASRDKTARVWDAKTGRLLSVFDQGEPVTCLAFSPDGDRIVSAGVRGSVKVWEPVTRREVFNLAGHWAVVQCVAFGRRDQIATASRDRTIRLWDAKSGKHLRTLRGHTGHVTAVDFDDSGSRLVSGSLDKTIRFWDPQTGNQQRVLNHTGFIARVDFSPDGQRIVTSGTGGAVATLKIWDATTSREFGLLQTSRLVDSLAYSPDGRRILTGEENDPTLKVWDAESHQPLQTLKGHKASILHAEYSPDGKRIVTASGDKTIKIWDATTARELRTLEGHSKEVTGAAFSPDGARIVSSCWDGTVKIWNAETGRELHSIKAHSELTRIAFRPNGRHFVSWSLKEPDLKVWDVETGSVIRTLKGHKLGVVDVAYRADGQRIVSGGFDEIVRVWDASTGEVLKQIKGHTLQVNTVAFSPDGRRVITGSKDKTVKIWDTATGWELYTLPKLDSPVVSLAVSPGGRRIAVGSFDRGVRIWDAGPHFKLPGKLDE